MQHGPPVARDSSQSVIGLLRYVPTHLMYPSASCLETLPGFQAAHLTVSEKSHSSAGRQSYQDRVTAVWHGPGAALHLGASTSPELLCRQIPPVPPAHLWCVHNLCTKAIGSSCSARTSPVVAWPLQHSSKTLHICWHDMAACTPWQLEMCPTVPPLTDLHACMSSGRYSLPGAKLW